MNISTPDLLIHTALVAVSPIIPTTPGLLSQCTLQANREHESQFFLIFRSNCGLTKFYYLIATTLNTRFFLNPSQRSALKHRITIRADLVQSVRAKLLPLLSRYLVEQFTVSVFPESWVARDSFEGWGGAGERHTGTFWGQLANMSLFFFFSLSFSSLLMKLFGMKIYTCFDRHRGGVRISPKAWGL